MKTAFAYWENRIAPVFDTARQIHIVEAGSGKIIGEAQQQLPEAPAVHKVLRLVELDIETLVCGAISRSLQGMVVAYGIQVIAFVAGDLQGIIQAWLQGNFRRDAFAMPGCRGRGHQRFRGMHHMYQEGYLMNGKGRGGGAGAGRGQGRGGQKAGRMGGSAAAGPAGDCVCPKCGQREAHQRGMPCVERTCPKCGTAMVRS